MKLINNVILNNYKLIKVTSCKPETFPPLIPYFVFCFYISVKYS